MYILYISLKDVSDCMLFLYRGRRQIVFLLKMSVFSLIRILTCIGTVLAEEESMYNVNATNTLADHSKVSFYHCHARSDGLLIVCAPYE